MLSKHLALPLLVLSCALAAAQPAENYCAVFNPTANTLEVPCIAAGGSAYRASLTLQSANPMRFAIASVVPSTLAPTPGQCAVFEPGSGRIGLPCVTVGSQRLWATLNLQGTSASLVNAGGSVPTDCQALVDAPAGVSLSITATGEAAGTVARAVVRNDSSQAGCYCAYAGQALRNADPAYQNLGLIQRASVCLQPGQQSEMTLDGSCLNAELNTPAAGQALSLVRDSRTDLQALLQTIERERTDYSQIPVITFSVWALTDATNPIGGTLSAIQQMYRLAGLDPAQYPGLAHEIQIPTVPGLPGSP
jgi:hypothetical protein